LRAAQLPEKIGDLVASLHFLLVCKILRRIINGNEGTELIAVYGLLLDKTIDCAHCKMIRRTELPGKLTMLVEICSAIGEWLMPNLLCHHFTSMLT